MRSIHARGCDVTATTALQKLIQPILNRSTAKPLAVDNFIQVVSFQLNYLKFCENSDVYVCTKIDRLQMSSGFMADSLESKTWTIYSYFTIGKSKNFISDIFVFDHETQYLVLYILGIHFTGFKKNSLTEILSQSNVIGGISPANPEQDVQRQSLLTYPTKF